ncbi:ParB/RepB/Spo0J family partition protein [Massilia sp. PWRC2]|uniref:ParB/RepB/Spo0J family partition protein n=1 Tax=Massilia sp. PWRC2 TaxID=2804626 RepID=UPI003CFB551D
MSEKRFSSTRHSGPLDIDIGLIDEDPQQPRTADNPGFSATSLNELAASIRLRGVKTPISVRDNPRSPGRYIINHGARRYRSARLVGNLTIPGFVDNDYNEADQVIENLQRNALTPREVANFIGRELAKGLKKGEIAHAISKSPAFVTQHANLLDLPDVIATAFNSGRARDVTVVNELLIAHKKHADEVGAWLRDESQEITRGSVKQLRQFLADVAQGGLDASADFVEEVEDVNEAETAPSAQVRDRAEVPSRIRTPVLQVRHLNRSARLLLHRLPSAQGMAWCRYDDAGDEREILLAEVTLVALLDN